MLMNHSKPIRCAEGLTASFATDTKLYVILPVHNRINITQKFIECLKTQKFTDYHLVLIDDGSTDGTAEMVLDNIYSITVIKGTGKWWWAGSLQKGIDWLKQQNLDKKTLILFINDDVTFSPNYFENAVSVMAYKKRTLVLSRFIDPDTNEISETGVYADWKRLKFKPAENPSKINCLSTRGLFLHWSDICEIGDFHPLLLPHYASDLEYTIRAYKKGLKCETSSEILIVPDLETTGYKNTEYKGLFFFLSKLFSKKYIANPIYMFVFVLMASDKVWIIPNCLRILTRTFRRVKESIKSAR